jgi:hypothetical protein
MIVQFLGTWVKMIHVRRRRLVCTTGFVCFRRSLVAMIITITLYDVVVRCSYISRNSIAYALLTKIIKNEPSSPFMSYDEYTHVSTVVSPKEIS